MKLIIIALTINHHSLYLGLIQYLEKHFEKISILILKNSVNHYYEYFDNPRVNIIEETGATDKIVIRNIKLINEHDVLIYDENYSNFIKLAFYNIKVKKFIYIVHNSNKHFQNKCSLNLKIVIKKIFMSIFIKNIDAFIVMGPNIKDYASIHELTRPVFFFPFDLDKEYYVKENKENTLINIVIPGTIDSRRRNYKSFMDIIEFYIKEKPNTKIRINFLGRIISKNDEYVADISENINKKYGEKIYYKRKFIPSSEFEKAILDADYLLSNIHVYNKHNDRIEIYGTTKESGISFLIYKYEKPAIVPEAQRILSGFNSQLIYFKKYHDLLKIFKNIEEGNIDYGELIKNAKSNKRDFNNEVQIEINNLLEYIKG